MTAPSWAEDTMETPPVTPALAVLVVPDKLMSKSETYRTHTEEAPAPMLTSEQHTVSVATDCRDGMKWSSSWPYLFQSKSAFSKPSGDFAFTASSLSLKMLNRNVKPPLGLSIPTSPTLTPTDLYSSGLLPSGSGIHNGYPYDFESKRRAYVSCDNWVLSFGIRKACAGIGGDG